MKKLIAIVALLGLGFSANAQTETFTSTENKKLIVEVDNFGDISEQGIARVQLRVIYDKKILIATQSQFQLSKVVLNEKNKDASFVIVAAELEGGRAVEPKCEDADEELCETGDINYREYINISLEQLSPGTKTQSYNLSVHYILPDETTDMASPLQFGKIWQLLNSEQKETSTVKFNVVPTSQPTTGYFYRSALFAKSVLKWLENRIAPKNELNLETIYWYFRSLDVIEFDIVRYLKEGYKIDTIDDLQIDLTKANGKLISQKELAKEIQKVTSR